MTNSDMARPEDCLIVIFGASGDLAKRKLIPALYALSESGLLPQNYAVLGVSRTKLDDDAFRHEMEKAIMESAGEKSGASEFISRLYYQVLQTAEAAQYDVLKKRLQKLCADLKLPENYIFYLSTPPGLYKTIASNLGAHGLHKNSQSGWKRIIVEKPFGRDLESALDLNTSLQKFFDEDQIYRIDHYLGKETVQNIIAFRFSNGIYEPLWNRNFIHHVEITAAEHIGIENRGGYYEQSGALRDMLQNHLLQILGTVAMEPPPLFNDHAVRNETVKVFESLQPFSPETIAKNVIRGQYLASRIRGKEVPGYREEANVATDSRVETYVAMKLHINNWRWGGVPFYMRTGKRLPTRVTEVVIHFKQTPHALFSESDLCDSGCNQLILRIQPDEGILLRFGMKLPGAGFKIKNVSMDFHYSDLAGSYIASAYERLLLDSMLGDATLYARADAVEACWRFVNPVLRAWENDPQQKIYGYPAGTWGPVEAKDLFGPDGEDWRYPCKNLTNDGEYCEL